MRISILQFSPDGTVIYSEDHAVTTNSQGIVNLKIGSGISADEFAAINWSNGPYFIKIEIDTEGSANYIELGTTQLLSVPYALYADKAGSVLNESGSYWSKNGNNLYYNNGYVGVGSVEPASLLDIQGNVGTGTERNLLQLANISDGGMAYTGILLKTGESGGQSVIQDYGLTYTASTYYDFAGFLNLSNNNHGVMLHANSSDGVIKFYTGYDNIMGAGVERMRIDQFGRIGIGTSDPIAKLNIVGTVNEGDDRSFIRIKNNSTSSKAQTAISLHSFDDKSATLGFESSTYSMYDLADFGFLTTNGRGFAIMSPTYDGQVRFYTNIDSNGPIERMRINESGNIGIGTIMPASMLDIQGDIGSGSERNLLRLMNSNEGAMSYTGMVLKTGNSNGHSVIQDYSMNYTASTYYDFAGFLNVSNNNRGVMLHANSTDGVIKFYTGHDDLMGAGIERLRIDSEGNVGIGTDAPGAKLEIADGDVYIKDVNKGIIMTSPNGQCWRGTINNAGVLEFVSITCP